MSFVTEAGYQACPAFCANSTLPLSASITSSASARPGRDVSAIAEHATATHIKARAGREECGTVLRNSPDPDTGEKDCVKPRVNERQKRKASRLSASAVDALLMLRESV